MENKLGLNPWLSIWVKPKETIRKIVEFNPNFRLFVLSVIYGFISLMSISNTFALGQYLHFVWIILISIVISFLWGYIVLSILAGFAYFTGKWLKGQAKFQEVRSALAWSSVPMIINILFWALLLIVFGGNLLTGFPVGYALARFEITFLFSMLLGMLIFGIWSLVIFINALAEVQKFSVGKSILNIIFASVIIIIIYYILWAIF